MTKKTFNRSIHVLKDFGPGLITGAADDDPSGIATYTVAGAQSGYGYLWTALLTWPLMAAVQFMCSHISLVTKESLTNTFLKKYPKWIVFLLINALLIANTLNVAADLSAMADALSLLTGTNSFLFVIALGGLITVAMIFLNYQQIARLLTWMTFFLMAYIFTAFKSDVNSTELLKGTLIPHWPVNNTEWATLVAILGTTISPYLFFWQSSQEVEEIRQKESGEHGFNFAKIRVIRKFDILLGTFVSNLVMYFVILTAASTLHSHQITDIETTKDAALALEPLLGKSAVLCYTLGILGVGLLAIPTLVGSASFAIADFFKWTSGLDKKWDQAKSFYLFLSGSMVVAILIDIVHINPIKALFYSSIVNGVISPILILACLFVVRDRNLMLRQSMGKVAQVLIAAAAFLMILAAGGMFIF